MTTDTDIIVHLDEEGFLEAQVDKMLNRIKTLEYDLAELTVENNQLKERVKILAGRTPTWPKGYRPNRSNRFHKTTHNQRY